MIKLGDVEMAIEAPSSHDELIPSQYLVPDLIENQEILSHLRWMMQKGNLGQDMFLIGPPGPQRRRLAFLYAQLRQIEVEYVSISRDVTESDLKQRKEIVNGTALYMDQACVRAAIYGRLLVLDGVEKAERNVLPILNNLLENREMALEDGRFLMHHARFDELQERNLISSDKLIRTSEKFLIIALGLPTPKYEGFSLDPPFRSRFQARYIGLPSIDSQSKQYYFLRKRKFDLILKAQHILQDMDSDQGARVPDFPIYLDRFGTLLSSLPGLHPRDSLVLLYPFLELNNADSQMVNLVNSIFERLNLSKTESTDQSCELLDISSNPKIPISKLVRLQVRNSTTKQINTIALSLPSGKLASTRLASFVETKYHSRMISLMFQAHAVGDICIIGEKGSGKSIIARHFAHLLGYSVECIPLYKDMSSRDLLQRRSSNSNGDTIWENSGLVKAALNGSIALLDPIDALPLGTLGSLQRLIMDREFSLPDGSLLVNHQKYQYLIKTKGYTEETFRQKRIFMIHQSFRIIALAKPDKPFVSRGKWLNQEVLSMFSFVPIRPMNIEEEDSVLKILFPTFNADQIQKITKLAHALRTEKDETIQEIASSFSTRQLIRIARRMMNFPDENLFSAIMKISLFQFLPSLARDALKSFLDKHGIKESHETDKAVSISHITTKDGRLCLKIGNVTAKVFDNAPPSLIPKVLFYENQRQNMILLDILKDFVLGEHMLLIGNQGVGKNKIVDYFLQLMRLPRKYIQLHRDTTVYNLTTTPILVNGKLIHADSPLVDAVKEGYILVVDEVDKAPTHVTSILKSLVEDKQMVLADGRKITGYHTNEDANEIHIHGDFRMICLANRPGFPFLGNDFYREIGDVFASHCVDNPDPQSELELLLNYGTELSKDILQKLIAAFNDLRKLAETGLINYPYSTRELVNVVKHLKANPGDGIGRSLQNVFDFDSKSDVKDIIRDVMSKNGLPINMEANYKVFLGESTLFAEDPILIERWNINPNHQIELPLIFQDIFVRGTWAIEIPKDWTNLEQINGRTSVFSEWVYSFKLFASENLASDIIQGSDRYLYAISASPVKFQIISPNHRMQKTVLLHEFIPSTNATKLSLFEIGIGKLAIHNSQEHNIVILNLLNGTVTTVLIKDLDPVVDSICSEKMNDVQFLFQMNTNNLMILDLINLKQATVKVKDFLGVSTIEYFKDNQWLLQDQRGMKYLVIATAEKLLLNAIVESGFYEVGQSNMLTNISGVGNELWSHSVPKYFYGLVLKPSQNNEWTVHGWPRKKDDSIEIVSSILKKSRQYINLTPISSVDSSDFLVEIINPASKCLYRTNIKLSFGISHNGLPNESFSSELLGNASTRLSTPSIKKILELDEGDKVLILSISGECAIYQCIKDQIEKDLDEWSSLTGSIDENNLNLKYQGKKVLEFLSINEETQNSWKKNGANENSGSNDDIEGESGNGKGFGGVRKEISDEARKSGTIDSSFKLREIGEVSQITELQKELHDLRLREKLQRLELSDAEYLRFMKYRENVAHEIRELRAILESVEARNKERIWKKNQTSGEIDDDKLIEGLAGERSVYKVRGENEDNFFQTLPKRLFFVFDLSASMLRFNGYDGRMDRSLECALMLMEAFKGFEHKFKCNFFGHSGDGPAFSLFPNESVPQNEKDFFNVLNRMLNHAQYTISGDNTLAAISTAIKDITVDEADDYFVLIVSDANLHQYNITPYSLKKALQTDSRVNACMIFIGNISNQADRISSDLNGYSHNCLDNSKLPKIIKNVFLKSMLK